MRLILLAALALGCVTSGQVRGARVAQIGCLDAKISQLQWSGELGEGLDRANRDSLACWQRARSSAVDKDVSADVAACRQIDQQAQAIQAQLAASDRRASEMGAACEIAKVTADELQTERDDQAAAADAALAGIQVAGRARQDMAATQSAAPRPIMCSSSQVGAQTYTTCR